MPKEAWDSITTRWPLAATIVAVASVLLYLLHKAAAASEDLDKLERRIGRLPWFNPRGRRRALLAAYLRRGVDLVDRKENWADHSYVELEVEIRPGDRPSSKGWGRLLPRRRRLRRARSLSAELSSARDNLVLIEGEPGSGKSIALRHFAQDTAARSIRVKRAKSRIPIYVNLKGFDTKGERVDANLLRSYVRQTLEKSPEVSRIAEEEFDKGVQEGTWSFLFDSFDELPEILQAVDVNRRIEEYGEAFAELAGGHQCPVVVASRIFRAPRERNWTVFRIVPLSDRRRRRFIRAAGLTAATRRVLINELPASRPEIAALASNPLFLTLLCEYMREEPRLPNVPHDVFRSQVDWRLERVAPELLEGYKLTSTEAREISSQVAFTMPASGLGLEPRRATLLAAMPGQGFTVTDLTATCLDALEWDKVRLARGEGDPQNAGARTFTFAHRRFQEYFATLLVMRDRERVTVDDLLSNGQWRETAVALCQLHPSTTGDLVREARERLAAAARSVPAADAGGIIPRPPASRIDFAWPPGSVHLLDLLQSGFAVDPEALPDDLRSEADAILRSAWAHGGDDDRKVAIQLAATASMELRVALLRAGFGSGIQYLSDAAYRQMARMQRLPEPLVTDMRRALVEMGAAGRLSRERQSVRAQIRRLGATNELLRALSLLLFSRRVDAVLHAVAAAILVWAVVDSAGPLDFIVVMALVAVPLSFSGWRSIAGAIAAAGLPESGGSAPDPGTAQGATPAASVMASLPPALLSRTFVAFGAVGAVAGLASSANVWLFFGTAVFLATWSWASIFAVLRGEMLRPSGWPFVHLVALRAVPATGYLVGLVSLVGGGLLGLAIAAAGVRAFEALHGVGDYILGGILIVPFAGLSLWFYWLGFKTFGHDLFWYWFVWRRSAARPLRPLEFLQYLGTQRTPGGLVRVVADVRNEHLLADGTAQASDAELVVRDLLRAAEHSPVEDDPLDGLRLDSELVRTWLAEDAKARLGLLRGSGSKLRDELLGLLDDVRARRSDQPAV